MLKISRKREK